MARYVVIAAAALLAVSTTAVDGVSTRFRGFSVKTLQKYRDLDGLANKDTMYSISANSFGLASGKLIAYSQRSNTVVGGASPGTYYCYQWCEIDPTGKMSADVTTCTTVFGTPTCTTNSAVDGSGLAAQTASVAPQFYYNAQSATAVYYHGQSTALNRWYEVTFSGYALKGLTNTALGDRYFDDAATPANVGIPSASSSYTVFQPVVAPGEKGVVFILQTFNGYNGGTFAGSATKGYGQIRKLKVADGTMVTVVGADSSVCCGTVSANTAGYVSATTFENLGASAFKDMKDGDGKAARIYDPVGSSFAYFGNDLVFFEMDRFVLRKVTGLGSTYTVSTWLGKKDYTYQIGSNGIDIPRLTVFGSGSNVMLPYLQDCKTAFGIFYCSDRGGALVSISATGLVAPISFFDLDRTGKARSASTGDASNLNSAAEVQYLLGYTPSNTLYTMRTNAPPSANGRNMYQWQEWRQVKAYYFGTRTKTRYSRTRIPRTRTVTKKASDAAPVSQALAAVVIALFAALA